MTTTVNDPGYKNGRIIENNKPYQIEIIKDGVVTQTIDVCPQYKPLITWAYVALQVILFFTAITFSDLNALISWGGVLITLQLIHLGLSLKNVNADELGAVLFYGTPVKRVSGLTLVPLGILTLIKFTKKLNQIQFPSDPEKVWKAKDVEYFALPKDQQEKYALPIRALTAAPSDKADNGILDTQMTIEVTFYVKWTIEQFWIFFVRIGTPEEMERQLRDSGERVLIQEIATRTPQQVQQDLKTINKALTDELEAITHDSGIRIDEASMLSPDLTHGVSSALRDITVRKAEAAQLLVTTDAQNKATVMNAKAAAESTVLAAQAAKKAKLLDAGATKVYLAETGDGAAHATEVGLEALAKGAEAISKANGGQAIVDLEKAKALAGGKATVFVGGDQATSLFGIGAQLASGAQAVKKPEQTDK